MLFFTHCLTSIYQGLPLHVARLSSPLKINTQAEKEKLEREKQNARQRGRKARKSETKRVTLSRFSLSRCRRHCFELVVSSRRGQS